MSKFLEEAHRVEPVMPAIAKREEVMISLKKVKGDLQANQMGWKRALSRGDRRAASNIQNMIENLEVKRARLLRNLREDE